MVFNQSRSGQIVELVNGEVWRYKDGTFSAVTAILDSGAYTRVTLTGWTAQGRNGVTFWQTTSGNYINLADGWNPIGQSAGYPVRTVQSYINEIIENNKIILQNNLICARFADKMTSAQLAQLRGLQSRLNVRNKSLQEDGLVTNVETSYPRGYADLAQALNDVMAAAGDVPGVGIVVSTTVVIVVSAVVVASLATAAYFAYKAYAAESKEDVKFSKELTKTLTSKLTTEEWMQLREETQGIVTKARVKQSLSNLGSLGKIVLFAGAAVGGYVLYKKYFKKD